MRTTIDTAGRIVIPKPIRDELRLKPGIPLEISSEGGAVVIEHAPVPKRLVNERGHLVVHADGPIPPLTDEIVRETLESIRRKL